MRRLAARLVIAGIALAVGGTAAGCSAAPGLAYAQGATRPASRRRRRPGRLPRWCRPSARAKIVPAGPGARRRRRPHGSQGEGRHPGGRHHRPGALGGGRERGAADRLDHQGDDRARRPPGGRPEPADHRAQGGDRLRRQVRRERRRPDPRPDVHRRRAAAHHAGPVGGGRGLHPRQRLRPRPARVHRQDERGGGQARPDPHALHLARRPAVPDGDLHLLHPGGARDGWARSR